MVQRAGNESLRVLVIDDHVTSRRYATAALRQNAATVKQAASGETGIRIALHWLPDVILLDLWLPDLDGSEVVRRIRRNWPAGRKAPRIVLLSAATSSDPVTPGAPGMADLRLAKPVAPLQLRQAVFGTGEHGGDGEYPPEFRTLCRNELRSRLRKLGHCLDRADYVAAGRIVHLMIAASAYASEKRMEQALRLLQSSLEQEATPSIAAAYYGVLEAAEYRLG